MEKFLNHKADLDKKLKLYGFPTIETEYHRTLADRLNSGDDWLKKLQFAQNDPVALDESEFHFFELYKPEYSLDDISAYVGKKRQSIFHRTCNSPYWVATSNDKALLELVLRGAGLPVANTLAIHSRDVRYGFKHQLHNLDDLEQFLSNVDFPIFAKPVDGMYGIGGFQITDFYGTHLKLNTINSVSIQEFYTYCRSISQSGYLFQNFINQHHQINDRFGPTINTIRFLVFNTGEPKIESALIKIGAPSASADNFWQPGSILCGIDIQSGVTCSALQNNGIVFHQLSIHPTLHSQLVGCLLPHWEAAKHLVINAASLFPEIRTQSWDIALSEQGPLVVEFNWGGDLNLHQLIQNRGMFTTRYAEHLERCQVLQGNL